MSRINRSGDVSIWEVPEIDGVRRSLERAWEDELSDTYWKLIDRVTDPAPMTPMSEFSIASKLWELHCREGFIEAALESGAELFDTPELPAIYRSALAQVTEVTGIDTYHIHTL